MLPCSHAPMLPCFHASMRPCFHASMPLCFHASMFLCFPCHRRYTRRKRSKSLSKAVPGLVKADSDNASPAACTPLPRSSLPCIEPNNRAGPSHAGGNKLVAWGEKPSAPVQQPATLRTGGRSLRPASKVAAAAVPDVSRVRQTGVPPEKYLRNSQKVAPTAKMRVQCPDMEPEIQDPAAGQTEKMPLA